MAFLFWLACTCHAGNGNWNTFVFKTLKFSHLMRIILGRHLQRTSLVAWTSCTTEYMFIEIPSLYLMFAVHMYLYLRFRCWIDINYTLYIYWKSILGHPLNIKCKTAPLPPRVPPGGAGDLLVVTRGQLRVVTSPPVEVLRMWGEQLSWPH